MLGLECSSVFYFNFQGSTLAFSGDPRWSPLGLCDRVRCHMVPQSPFQQSPLFQLARIFHEIWTTKSRTFGFLQTSQSIRLPIYKCKICKCKIVVLQVVQLILQEHLEVNDSFGPGLPLAIVYCQCITMHCPGLVLTCTHTLCIRQFEF